MATRALEWVLVLGAAVSGCGGEAEPQALDALPVDQAALPTLGSPEMEPPFEPSIGADPPSSIRREELRQLADDYLHKEVGPDDRGATLAQIRALSPRDGKAFRSILAERSGLSGIPLEVYQAMTDVAFEHRASAFALDPSLVDIAVRRAFERYVREWGRERVEEAVERYLDSLQGGS
jgi:hypothetical protein